MLFRLARHGVKQLAFRGFVLSVFRDLFAERVENRENAKERNGENSSAISACYLFCGKAAWIGCSFVWKKAGS